MTQGNNPKNKSSKQTGQTPANKSAGGQPPKSSSPQRTGSGTDRPFTQKSRVRTTSANPSRPGTNEGERRAGGAGSRAAERKQEREQEQRRRQLTIVAGVIITVVVLAALVLLIVRTPADAPIPESALTRYEGLASNRTQEGYPQLGDSNAAVRVAVYSSFDCTHCREFHEELQSPLIDRVRAGGMSLIFVPLYGTGSVTNGQGAARAAICAENQGKFWEMQDALFYWQGLYVNQAFTNNRLQTGASDLGLDVGAFNGCISGDATTTVLNNATASRVALGASFVGTPTVTINGVVPTNSDQVALSDRQEILAAIDEAIARLSGGVTPETTPAPEAAATVEATLEATTEAAAPLVEVTPEVTPEVTAAS